jgi:3-hydroxyisobutyrate dehydrogenase-like beta-hydroxyacid dehydrogenase
MPMNLQRLGLVGFGEVGRIFASGLQPHVVAVSAWDTKFPTDRDGACTAAIAATVGVAESIESLCVQSDWVISAVTASNTLAVAQAAAPYMRAGMVYLDLNSASPGTKQQAAALIEATGAQYVEVGVMTSVPPYGIRVPMLLGGAQAQELAQRLNAMGMDAKAVSNDVGIASAIKMCRSVMIKGLEALVIESYTTARAYGVEDHVLPTLVETFPSIDWGQAGAYFFSRVVQHGQRRAEEMRESANTVLETGFAPLMATAIAAKQQWVADQARAGVFAGLPKGAVWQDYADALLASRDASAAAVKS